MGPLAGYRILEMAGIGPAPFCGMLLADMGADVLRIDRLEPADLGLDLGDDPRFGILGRGKRSVAVNVKSDEGRKAVLDLVRSADALIEGFRPGAMERLGLGPDACLAVKPELVFGRITGWGQSGELARTAGHDINYIALSGVLHAIGQADRPPTPPLNLVGDFGGGAMFLAVGVLCALLEAKSSGKGQVVDAAMVDGSAYLAAALHGMLAKDLWVDERGVNILDGGAPYYGAYETKDGKFVSIGSIERRFYAELLDRLGLAGEDLPKQQDKARWGELAARFAAVFKTRTRDEWCAVFEGSDACFAPVLSMREAQTTPHLAGRNTFTVRDDIVQPAPAPRFSRSEPKISRSPPRVGEDGETALIEWGLSAEQVSKLRSGGVIGRDERGAA